MTVEAIDPDVADWLDNGGGGDPYRRKGTSWSPRVREQAAWHLNAWCRFLAARNPAVVPLKADARMFRKWLGDRATAGYSDSVVRKDWQYIRAFYTNASTPLNDGGMALLAADPMAGVRGPHVSTKPSTRAAKPEEVDALILYYMERASLRRAGGEAERALRNAAMVSLMFRSGCRSGELPWIDMDDLITVDGRKAIQLKGSHTKSGETRLVPVTEETDRLLKRYLRRRGDAPGPLFRGRIGKTRARDDRMSAPAVQDVVSRAAKKLGLPVSAHQLRRGWVAQYLRAGGDTVSMEVIGGWSDSRMPGRYLADERSVAALARFHAVTDPGSRLRAV